MRSTNVASWMLTGLLVLAGCGEDGSGEGGSGETGVATTSSGETTGAGPTTGSSGTEVPLSPGTPEKPAYPEGPYGIGVDSVLRNYQFVGYSRPNEDRVDLEVVSLSDFYNPTGTDVFPDDGRAWAGQPKPKALAISVSAYWCPPCRDEWKNDIPPLRARLGPKGGEFWLLMSDGAVPGDTPVTSELDSWIASYEVTAPAVLDATQDFYPVWESNAFPTNVLVRTSDMRIIEKVAGRPLEDYWVTMEDILDGVI